MCSIDLEPCDVWLESHVRARKEHVCDGCGAVIRPGRRYLKHFNIFGGDKTSEKMCAACERARQEFADAHGQSITPSSLDEMLQECVQGDDSDETKRWRILYARLRSRHRKSREQAAFVGLVVARSLCPAQRSAGDSNA